MRSVFVLSLKSINETNALLNELAEWQPRLRAWTFGHPNTVLWCTIGDLDTLGMEDSHQLSMLDALGDLPEYGIQIDVSGKIRGFEEVMALACELLARLDGVAMDDHSDKMWTLDELQEQQQLEQPEFFLGLHK